VVDTPEIFLRKAACAVLPRGFYLSRRLSDGTIVGGPNRHGFGGRGAFIFGDQLEPEFNALAELIRPGQTLIDVGANSGIYTLRGARIVGPSGLVLSLEPNPEMLYVLARNIRRNRLTNVRIRGLGAADRCGEFSFYENFHMPNSFSLVKHDQRAHSFSIAAVDLDSLVQWERIEHVDLIKIDAEGAEDRILRGAAKIIERSKPVIIAEFTTKGLTVELPGYRTFGPRGSPNRVMVPDGHPLQARMPELGWVQVSPKPSPAAG
jgi:FkbM family methyltransferase